MNLSLIQKYKYRSYTILLCFIIVLLYTANGLAQSYTAKTEFKYIKNTDQSRALIYKVKFIKPGSKNSTEAIGIPITFTTGLTKEKLATLKTNSYGEAKIIIPASKKIPSIKGQQVFFATIDKNTIIKPASNSISVADLQLEMSLILKDSVKTIVFQAFEIDSKKNKIPIQTDINIYVPRTFSELKIAETSTNKEGYGEVKFAKELPGDSIGNVTIICRVEDNNKYANVEKSQTINWGVPTNYHIAKFHRALWTTIAPTWMIVTLTILLTGVWGHYIYVISKLYKIKKEGKKISQL